MEDKSLEMEPKLLQLLRAACARLPCGEQLLRLLRLVWRWARHHRADNGPHAHANDGDASASASASPCSAKNGSGSTTPAAKSPSASPKTAVEDASASPKNAVKNGFASPSAVEDGSASTTCAFKNPSAAKNGFASPTATVKDSSGSTTTSIKKKPVASTSSSSTAARPFRSRSYIPTLFSVACPLCGWTDRVPFPVLVQHLSHCSYRRHNMQVRMDEARAEQERAAAAARHANRRRW